MIVFFLHSSKCRQIISSGRKKTNTDRKVNVTVVLPLKNVSSEGYNHTCVYWNFSANEGAGGWQTEGCVVTLNLGGVLECQCDHLTNFAVLLVSYAGVSV